MSQLNTIWNPATLPSDDNIPDNDYSFCIDLNQPWFMSKGAMIAYYGQMNFTALTHGLSGQLLHMVAQQFSAPLHLGDFVVAEGQGKLVVGDRGYNINAYDLDDGNLTIRAANLLAFQPQLSLQQSIVPGFLTLIGTGKFLASSNGPVMFAEPPVRVDPEALVGWADCPSPSHHFDEAWVNSFIAAAGRRFGINSGEERQFDFTGSGTVLIQSSEKVRNDTSIVRTIQGHLPGLSVPGLQQINQEITQQLGQQQ
ncbi:AIM24 family protein [Gordonia polyisoprenivorans]|uniref:AIM24 family protein n=1 Tax=Gordonia polyisoprenivorans TaxID=84595 RepID=UPI001AD79692|nr:AIM24 family protein [Gordonia polyisoprenivorans]QTI69443.1 AIM24 family protein [Gordonia polyisoprenivorans]